MEAAFGFVSVGLTSGIAYMYKKLKATHSGVRALLRHEIIQEYNRCKDRGYCPIYSLENVEGLYKAYKALGGNGTITTLMNELHDMPRQIKQGV